MNLTITFADYYYYSKYYCGHSVASTDAKGEATTHAARHNRHRKGSARFRSLDFSERNGYLKGIAPIDAQQKNMELRTFSCSRGSSWTGTLPVEVWPPWPEDVSSNFINWPT